MGIVKIEPMDDEPVPYDVTDEKTSSLLEELAVSGKTAELQAALGAVLNLSEDDVHTQTNLLDSFLSGKEKGTIKTPLTAVAASRFLQSYGSQLALDIGKLRSAITHKLMEIANCGDPKYELKALELLGKHSDVGLFTERSEITVNYRNPEELQSAIVERVKRLLNADVIDITPLNGDLDDILGVADVELPPVPPVPLSVDLESELGEPAIA